MSVRVPASPNSIEQKSVLGVLKQSAPSILLASGLAAGIAFALLSLAPPRFQSTAELHVSPEAASKGVEIHLRGLQSPDLLARVADDLKLSGRAEFNDGPATAVRASVDVRATGDRRLAVRFTSRDAALAAETANKIADLYVRSLAPEGLGALDAERAALKRQMNALAQSLQVDRAQIALLQREIDSAAGTDAGSIDANMAALSNDFEKATAARNLADDEFARARDLATAGTAATLAQAEPFALVQDLMQQRARAERQMADLKTMLSPGHPRVRQIEADLARLKKRITGEIGTLLESTDTDAKAAAERAGVARTNFEGFKARIAGIAVQRDELRKREATALALQAEVRVKQDQIAENQKAIDKLAAKRGGEVVTRAQPSSVPLPTKTMRIAGLIFAAAMMLGAALVLARAFVIRARGAVRTRPAEKPLESVAPSAVGPVHGSGEISISAVVDRLEKARSMQGGYRTLVTAAAPDGIDSGIEAYAIAERLAEVGRSVVLIDWNRRGVAGSASAGLPSIPGFNDLIVGSAGFEDVVRRVRGTGVHAIACGNALPDDGGSIDVDLMNLALDALDEAYDHIIVAGPHREARYLFEAILGRFDTGMSVAVGPSSLADLDEPEGTFLGFPVADIDVIRFKRVTVPHVATRSPLDRIGMRGRAMAS